MGLFAKTKKNLGYLAVSFSEDGISAAHIYRAPAASPQVDLLAFHAANRSAADAPLEKLAKELRANTYQCTTLLTADEYQLLSVDAPNVPPDELKTAIRWRLKDMLDFRVDDATIDVLDVPVEKNAPVRQHSMYAVAARNQIIEHRQALFTKAKIPLSVIDIPEMAQRNISVLLEPPGRGVALLSFDARGGLLTATYSGELYLSRRIDVTLQQLEQSDADQKYACYERIALELQRSFDYIDRQYHFITLAKLVLFPGGAASEELQAYLTANLFIGVDILNLESILDITKAPDLKSLGAQQRHFLTLGAALRQEEKML